MAPWKLLHLKILQQSLLLVGWFFIKLIFFYLFLQDHLPLPYPENFYTWKKALWKLLHLTFSKPSGYQKTHFKGSRTGSERFEGYFPSLPPSLPSEAILSPLRVFRTLSNNSEPSERFKTSPSLLRLSCRTWCTPQTMKIRNIVLKPQKAIESGTENY